MHGLKDVDVVNLRAVKNRQVDSLSCQLSKPLNRWSTDIAKCCLKAAASTQPSQLRAQRVGAAVIAKEIRFRFQVTCKAVNGALVQAGLFRKVSQLKPVRRTIQ